MIVQLECTNLVFEERESRSTCRKTSCNKEDNQHIIMALMPGVESGPHRWQPSAFTTASFLLPCTILAPQLHPCSTAPSSLPCKILAPQLHPCSTAPSYLSCSILAPLDHHCLPSPSCFPVYPRLLAPPGNHVRKQFLNLKLMAHQWSYTILSSFKMVNSLLEAKIATKIKA